MRFLINSRIGLAVGGFSALALTTACSSARMGSADPVVDATAAEEVYEGPRLLNEIAQSEILARGKSDHTAMALVRHLRPAWLRPRGQKSINSEGAEYPSVYVDDMRRGPMASLNQIPAGEIQRMQFINGADATTRWGTGHASGVIIIVTGR